MYKFYKYIYYRIYAWNLKKWGKQDVPEFNALTGTTFLLLLNIGSLILIIQAITDYKIGDLFDVPKSTLILFAFVFILPHYFALYHKGKYKKIIEEFKGKDNSWIIKWDVWASIYIWSSVVMFPLTGLIIYLIK